MLNKDLRRMTVGTIIKMIEQKDISLNDVKNHPDFERIEKFIKMKNTKNNDIEVADNEEVNIMRHDLLNDLTVNANEFFNIEMNKKLKEYVDTKSYFNSEWITICEHVSSAYMDGYNYVFPNLKIEPHAHIEFALDVTDINGNNRIIEFVDGETEVDLYDSEKQAVIMSVYMYDDNYDLIKDRVDFEVYCFDENNIKIQIYAGDTNWDALVINEIVYLKQLQVQNKITDLEVDSISYTKLEHVPSWIDLVSEGYRNIIPNAFLHALRYRNHFNTEIDQQNIVSPFTDSPNATFSGGWSGPADSSTFTIKEARYSEDAHDAVGFSFVAEKTWEYTTAYICAENAIITITDASGNIIKEDKDDHKPFREIKFSTVEGNTYYILFSSIAGDTIHIPTKNGIVLCYNNKSKDELNPSKIMYMDNPLEYTPMGDYNPATKKYVDDAIQENGFSGDYNDLENRPVYDNSETKHYAYDGNQNGKTVVLINDNGTESQSLVKISDNVLTYEQFTNVSIITSAYGDFHPCDLKDLSKEEFESMVSVVENETGKAVICQMGVCAIHNDNFTMNGLTIPEKGLYVTHMAITSAAEASTSSFDKVISTFGIATGDVYVSDVYVETIDLKQLEEKFIPDTIARVANLPYCDTRTTEPAVITYDGNQSDKQVIVFKQNKNMQHAFVRINDSLSTIEAYEMISMSVTYSNGKLGDAHDIEIKRVNNDVVLLGYEDSCDWYIANVCSEFNMKTSLAISEDCILTEGLWFYQISEIGNAASLSNEIEAKVIIFSYINKFKYNKTIDGDWKQVDEYDNLTTKVYVDNAIAENGFSGDYNDLINRPCYDDRNYDVIECPEIFDGDISDRIVVDVVASAAISNEEDDVSAKGLAVIPRYVKISDIAPDLGIPMDNPETFMETFMDMMHKELIQIEVCYWDEGVEKNKKGMVTFDFDYIPEIEDYGFIDYYLKLTDMNNTAVAYFVYEEFTYESWGQSLSLTPGVWLIYGVEPNEDYTHSEAVFYGKTYTIKKYKDGELKELPSKYVSYKPGLRLDGQVIERYGEEITAGMYAEVFNAVENNIAIGTCSHAEGYATSAIGNYSHAEGSNTTANGDCSHAEGESTYANGDYSHAEGNNTSARGESQHVQGKFNIYDNENKYAHIVGNGNWSARSNAHTLDWDGNAWYQGQVQGTNLPHDTRVFEEIEIAFDGNTEGKETVLVKDPLAPVSLSDVNSKLMVANSFYVKVSDNAISYEEFCSMISMGAASVTEEGEFTEFEFSIEEMRQALIKINDDVFVIDPDPDVYYSSPYIVVTHEDITVDSVINYIQNDLILTPGIWFLCMDEDNYINKFKYQAIISGELKKLDGKYLPDSIANGINVITEEDINAIIADIDN